MNRRALFVVAAVLLTACGRTASSTTPSVTPGHMIVLGESVNGSQSGFTVRDSGTGKLLRRLPNGAPNRDWSRYYYVGRLESTYQLNAMDPLTGKTLAHVAIPSGFDLPRLDEGPDKGLSPDGQWIVLFRRVDNGGQIQSDFTVGSSSLAQPFKNIRLDGDFSFDAISNDGKSLYLIHYLDNQGDYQVRLYDLSSNTLVAHSVVDKREPDEPMYGIRGDSLADPSVNTVFTVYARPTGPFIHALPLSQPFAWCVDLPAGAGGSLEEQFHWSLVLSHDGSRIFAVNGSTAQVAVISVGPDSIPPVVSRSGQLALSQPPDLLSLFSTPAEAKEAPLGGAALSPDGRTLWALGVTGIMAIDTTTLKVRARSLEGHAVPSMRLSADGRWLHVAVPGSGEVWQLNSNTGALVGELKGLDNPWAVLWAN